jgi:hypothetical protein
LEGQYTGGAAVEASLFLPFFREIEKRGGADEKRSDGVSE